MDKYALFGHQSERIRLMAFFDSVITAMYIEKCEGKGILRTTEELQNEIHRNFILYFFILIWDAALQHHVWKCEGSDEKIYGRLLK